MPTAVFPPWKPDRADLLSGSSTIVLNVFRRKNGTYGPMRALSEVGNALNSACKGAASFYGSDGTIVTFAGTATKLYLWDGSSTWSDVTRAVGGAYTLADEHRWVFTQDEDRIFADNGIDARQYWDIGTSATWVNDPGSDVLFPPPVARYSAMTDTGFNHVGNTTTDRRQAAWCEQFDTSGWEFDTNQSDDQILREGGQITGIIGGEYVLYFQEQKIRRAFYVAPDTLIWKINEVSAQRGCALPGSIASFERTAVFAANDGWYRIDDGQILSRIGDGVDETFWASIAQDNFQSVWSIIDPRRPFLMVAWPTSTGVADTLWVCNLEINEWAPSAYNIECLFPMYSDVSVDLDTDSGEAGDSDLDTPGLPSLDSDQYRGSPIQIVAAFSSNHKLAFFSGATLEATLDTEEAQLGDGFRQVEVDRAIPLVSGGSTSVSPTAKLGYRNRQQDAVTYSSAVTADAQGDVYFREPAARYQRLRAILPAGMEFTHAVGANFLPADGGDR